MIKQQDIDLNQQLYINNVYNNPLNKNKNGALPNGSNSFSQLFSQPIFPFADHQLMAHVFFDGYIRGTNLEGAKDSQVSSLILSVLNVVKENFSSRFNNKIIEKIGEKGEISDNLLGFKKIVDSVQKNKNSNDGIRIVGDATAEEIRQLQVGQSFLVLGGYCADPEGHAMQYLVTKTGNKEYQFIVINTGANGKNVSHHASRQEERKKKLCPYRVFSRIPEEVLFPGNTSLFFQSLLFPNIFSQSEKYHSGVIYEGPLRPLHPYFNPHHKASKIFITRQRDGVCNWKSILAYLRLVHILLPVLSEKEYKKLHFYIRVIVLAAFYNKKYKTDEDYRMLLTATEVLSRECAKKEKTGEISSDEAKDLLPLLKIIRQEAKENIKIHYTQEPQITENMLTNPAFFQGGIKYQWTEPNRRLLRSATNRIAKARVWQPKCEAPKLNFKEPNPKKLLSQLKEIERVSSSCFEEDKAGKSIAVGLQIIEDFIYKIPLTNDVFWNSVNNKKECFQEMTALLQSYQEFSVGFDNCSSPTRVHTATSFSIAIFELCSRFGNKEYFTPYCPYNPLHHFEEDIFFQVSEEKDAVRLQEIANYFQKNTKKRELFNPESLKSIGDQPLQAQAESDFYLRILNEEPLLDNKLEDCIDVLKPNAYFRKVSISKKAKKVALLALSDRSKRDFFTGNLSYIQDLKDSIYRVSSFCNPRFDPSAMTKKNLLVRKATTSKYKIELGMNNPILKGSIRSTCKPLYSSSLGQKTYHMLTNETNLSRRIDKDRRYKEAIPLQRYSQDANQADPRQWIYRQVAWGAAERELQPMHLLNTFENHIQMLKDKDMQTMFWLQFFKTGNVSNGSFIDLDMKRQLSINPAMIEYITDWVRGGIRNFYDLQVGGRPDIPSCLFFIRFATQVIKNAEGIPEKKLQCDRLLEELDNNIKQWLKNKELTESERRSIHLHRLDLELERSRFTNKKGYPRANVLFPSYFVISNFKNKRGEELHFLEKSVRQRFQSYLTEKKSSLPAVKWERIVGEILDSLGLGQHVGQNNKDDFVVVDVPRIRSNFIVQQGDISLDLISGTVFKNDEQLSRGDPKLMLAHPNYQRIFGDQVLPFYQTTSSIYFCHPEFGEFRVINGDLDYGLQRKGLDGNWYQYISPNNVANWSDNAFPRSLISGYHHWIPIQAKDRIVVTDRKNLNASIATLSQDGVLHLNGKNRAVLRSFSRDRRKNFSIFDRSDYQLVSLRKPNQNENSYVVDSISLPRCSSLYGNRLFFTTKDNGKSWCWGDDPRYVVTGSRIKGLLGGIQNYLMLEKKAKGEEEKKQKVLIPLDAIDPETTQAFSIRGDLNVPQEEKDKCNDLLSPQVGTRRYLEYNLNENSLVPQNIEGTLFLAYLKLHAREQEEAFSLLSSLSDMDTLSPMAFDLLKRIILYPQKNKNYTPNNVAIALHAMQIYISHCFKKDINWQGEAFIKEFSGTLFARYLDRLATINSRYRFSPKGEEKLIGDLRRLGCYTVAIGKRSRYLSRKHSTPVYEDPALGNASRLTSGKVFYVWLPLFPGKYPSNPRRCLQVRNNYSNNSSDFFWRAYQIATKGNPKDRAALKYLLTDCLANVDVAKNGRFDYDQPKHFAFLWQIVSLSKDAAEKLPRPEPYFSKVCTYDADNYYDRDDARRDWAEAVNKELPDHPMGNYITALQAPNRVDAPLPMLPMQKQGDLSPLTIPKDLDWEGPLHRIYLNELWFKQIPRKIKNEPLVLPNQMHKKLVEDKYDCCIREEYKRLQADIAQGKKKLRQMSSYTLSEDMREKVKDRIDNGLENEIERKDKLEKDILTRANQVPIQELGKKLRILGNYENRLTMDHLEKFFLEQNVGAFQKANPYLGKRDVEQIFSLIAQWEISSISCQRLSSAQENLEKIEKLDEKLNKGKEEEHVRQFLVEDLHKLMSTNLGHFNRARNSMDLPALLVFARISGKRPRVDQLEDIEKIAPYDKDKVCVLQKIMGGGKTAILAALWSYFTASSGRLPVFFADRSQYKTVSNALKKSQTTCFGQKVFTFDYKREELSNTRLKDILTKLKEGREEKKLLVLCPEFLQLIGLERSITFHRLHKDASYDDEEMAAELLERFGLLNEMLQFFSKTHGVCQGLGDEVDLLLRSDREVNLPMGAPLHIGPERIALLREIFRHITKDDFLQKKIRLDADKQTLLTAEDWKVITPRIVGHLANTYKPLLLKDKGFNDAFVRFVTCSKKSGKQNIDYQFLEYIKKLSTSKDVKEREAAQLICMTKHVLHDLFPQAFRQSVGRHFGRWRDQDHPVKTPGKVIPYSATDTPSRSELGYHVEALIKQFMTAVQTGIEKVQIKRIAKEMESIARMYMQENEEDLLETAEAETFLRLTGIPINEVDNERSLEQACLYVNQSMDSKLAFEAETANIYTTYYEKRISSNAPRFTDLIPMSGMSGTPWNVDGYEENLANNAHLDVGTEGKIIQNILDRAEDTVVYETNPEKIEDLLQKAYNKDPKNFISGIFDAGAIFKKYSNKEMAEAILRFCEKKKITSKKGVVFFDRAKGSAHADQFSALVMRGGSPTLIPLEGTTLDDIKKAGLDANNLIAFLDEQHTTGIDVPFSMTARGILTVDETMLTRSFLQAVMRFRKFFYYQNIDFAISHDFKKQLPSVDDQPLISSIIQLGSANQGRQKADSIDRSYRQMLLDTIKKRCNRRLDQHANHIGERGMRPYYDVYKDFLFQEMSNDMVALFYGFEEAVTPIESLRNYRESLLSRFRSRLEKAKNVYGEYRCRELGLFDDYKTVEKDTLAILARAKKNRNLFAKEYLEISRKKDGGGSGGQVDLGIEMQQEIQIEQDVEIDVELETELQRELEQYNRMRGGMWRKETLWSENTANELLDKLSKKGLQTHEDIVSLPDSFLQVPSAGNRYQRFAKIFSKNISVTDNFRLTRKSPLPVFHKNQRLAKQVLVLQKEDKSFQFVLISEKEASFFRKFLAQEYKKNKRNNVWLVSPNGREMVTNTKVPFSSLSQKKAIQEGLTEINLFDGNFTSIMQQQSYNLAEQWVLRSDTPEKMDYLKLRFERHPLERKAIYATDLIHQDGSQKERIISIGRMEDDDDKVIDKDEIIKIRDPKQLWKLKDRYVPFVAPGQVKHLKPMKFALLVTPEQVREVPSDKVSMLEEEQMKLISPEQVPFVKKLECIQEIPDDTIKLLKGIKLPLEVFSHFTASQVKAIRDEELLFSLLDKQFVHISPDQVRLLKMGKVIRRVPNKYVQYIDNKYVDELTDHQLRVLSFDRLKLLSQPRIQAIKDRLVVSRLPEECVKKLAKEQMPLIEPTQVKYIAEPAYIKNIPGEIIHNVGKEDICFLKGVIPHLAPNQVKQIPDKGWLPDLRKEQVPYLDVKLCKYLKKKEHLAALSPSQLRKITVQKQEDITFLQKLPKNTFGYLQKRLHYYLSDKQLLEADRNIVEGLSDKRVVLIKDKNLIRKLPDRSLRYLQGDQIKEVSIPRLNCLIDKQYAHLSKTQVHALNKGRDIRKVAGKSLDFLRKDQVRFCQDKQIIALQKERLIQAVPNKKVPLLKEGQVKKISSSQVPHLQLSQVAYLKDNLLGYLSLRQVRGVRGRKSLRKLPGKCIPHLSFKQVISLKREQIRHGTLSQKFVYGIYAIFSGFLSIMPFSSYRRAS